MSEALTLVSDADKLDFVERALLRAVQDLQAAQKLQVESLSKEIELAKLHSKIARGDAASALGQIEARLQKCEKEQERLASSVIAADNGFLTISALQERLEKLEKFQEHLAHEGHSNANDVIGLRQPGSPSQTPDNEHSPQVAPQVAASPQASENETTGTKVKSDDQYKQIAEAYEPEESIWDVVILIGLPEMGSLGSVYVSICLLVNTLMQTMLCLIINDLFSESTFDDDSIKSMKSWRVLFGHSMDEMNPYTLQPFVASVCRFQPGMAKMVEASEVLATISAYIPTKEYYESQVPFVKLLPYFEQIGPLLCFMSLSIWLLTLAQEVNRMLAYERAVSNIPVSERSVLLKTEDSRVLKSVTQVRKMGCRFVLLVQIVLVILLSFSGVMYILYTIETQHLLRSLEPFEIDIKVARRLKGLSWPSILSVVLMLLIVVLATPMIHHQTNILRQTRHALCGGNLEFVAAQDAAGIISATRPPPTKPLEEEYFYKAIEQLVHGDERYIDGPVTAEDMSASSSGIKGGSWSLQGWSRADLDKVLDYFNGPCEDMLPLATTQFRWATQFLSILQSVVDDSSVSECKHVVSYCNFDDDKGNKVRQVCPATCGCNNPASNLVIAGTNGCPSSCKTHSLFTDSSMARECKDLAVSSPYWSNYTSGLAGYLAGYVKIFGDRTAEVEMIAAHGCDLLYDTSTQITILGSIWPNPCQTTTSQNLRPFSFACPVACSCADELMDFCPPKCMS